MKRNEKSTPEFDDIIFENRNKAYGAYTLRKLYNTATSLSTLGASAVCTLILLVIFFGSGSEATAVNEDAIIVIINPDNSIVPEKVKPPEPERILPETTITKYNAPEIVDDTVGVSDGMIINDDALGSYQNSSVTDSSKSDFVPVAIIPVETEPHYSVEEMPSFPGGAGALLRYIGENTIYPEEAAINNIQGKVIIKFAVEADGSVNRISVHSGVHAILDDEAVRVVKTLSGWTPGKQNGKAVPVWFTVPVNFRLK